MGMMPEQHAQLDDLISQPHLNVLVSHSLLLAIRDALDAAEKERDAAQRRVAELDAQADRFRAEIERLVRK